jgi:lincosamide nucleotidyltransferase A/C/D/E
MSVLLPRTGDTASAWTRTTDRANAVLWEMPLPHQLKVWLSQIVFHNPPMPRARVLEILEALDAAGLRTVMLGGWGVDALVGRQLRKHSDLDLVLEDADLDPAIDALSGLGYELWNSDEEAEALGPVEPRRTVSCRDGALRVVDLHGAALAGLDVRAGLIGIREVSCISAAQQLESQVGRTWTLGRLRKRRANVAVLRSLVAAEKR